MKRYPSRKLLAAGLPAICALAMGMVEPADAHALRERGTPVAIAKSSLLVTPPRDWNRLDGKPGKFAEVWTLDGEQLNEVTFYAGVEAGEPLVRESNRRREPLLRFKRSTLLADVPELLEGTYRVARAAVAFSITDTKPDTFLGAPGLRFRYSYTDADELPRLGEARAAIIGGKLYLATFDAPRLQFFDRSVGDFRALSDSAKLVH